LTNSPQRTRRRFQRLVSEAKVAEPKLPLVHTTDAFILRDIIEQEIIEPQICNVFNGELLTYFFYGRPSFRSNQNEDAVSLKHYFPVCLILRSSIIVDIERIFPFDSGGFENNFYANHIHKRMLLGDFLLEPTSETPGKLITTFFGSPSSYLRAQALPNPNIDESEFEAHSYMSLINSRDSNSIDSRGSGVEIQVGHGIDLNGSVQAIVLPSVFVDGDVGLLLKKLNIDIIPYRITDRSRPNEYFASVTDACYNYYTRSGIIDLGDL
jgi:hypothetical protein